MPKNIRKLSINTLQKVSKEINLLSYKAERALKKKCCPGNNYIEYLAISINET